MPIGNGGKFSTEARQIYDLVLEMQKVGVADIISMHKSSRRFEPRLLWKY